MSCRATFSVPTAYSSTPNLLRRTSTDWWSPTSNGAVRQRAIEARLEVEVQAFERHREWSRREAEAYHTIFRYLSPHISIHVAGLETSRDLWNELEERYRRMELATFCELFAQLHETTGERCGSAREFVDRVRLLVHRLNAIAPGSIGDKAHNAILLTQIGPEFIHIVDAIQNDKDPVNPTTIGNRLSNAEQTVRRKESPAPPQGAASPSINAVQRPPRNVPTGRNAAISSRSAGRNSENCNRPGTMP